MDEQAVRDVFTQAKAQDEADQRTRLGYMVKGAMDQLRAKKEVRLAAEKEMAALDDEIVKLSTAIGLCADGDSSDIEKWFARRMNDGACCNPMGRNPDPCPAPRAGIVINNA